MFESLDDELHDRGPIRVILGLGALAGHEHFVAALNDSGEAAIVRRCMDVVDLLASARMLNADVAVVNSTLRRWNEAAISEVRAQGLLVVALVEHQRDAADYLLAGADDVVVTGSMPPSGCVRAVIEAVVPRLERAPRQETSEPRRTERPGQLIAVWGPGGSPGRTVTAIGVADEAARAGFRTALVDADADAACVGPWLAMEGEVSGLSAMVRLAEQGMLTPESMAAAARSIESGLRVITGVTSRQRWSDIRSDRLTAVLELTRATHELTIVDLAAAGGPASHRDGVASACLAQADSVILVGSADPLGLMRLQGLWDARPEELQGRPVRVILTRARARVLGARPDLAVRELLPWAEDPVLIPDDPTSFDGCLRTGRTLAECSPRSKARDLHGHLVRALVQQRIQPLQDMIPGRPESASNLRAEAPSGMAGLPSTA